MAIRRRNESAADFLIRMDSEVAFTDEFGRIWQFISAPDAPYHDAQAYDTEGAPITDMITRFDADLPRTQESLRRASDVFYEEESDFRCAECGTASAVTYVVTTLDYSDIKGTRTEVCLSCHELITKDED